MRYVWSLWTKPLGGVRGSGWNSEKHHLLSWILSVETARRHGGTTCLVTDDVGARVLVDGLNLPFDCVTMDLNAMACSDSDWWALGKVYTYSLQRKPFVHIDSDVFLWSPLPKELLAAPVFAQCPESYSHGNPYYRCAEFEFAIASVNGWIPKELDRYTPADGVLQPVSCGILGANRIDFIRYFASLSLRMMEEPLNQDAWALLRDKNSVNLIFEQYFLAACLDYHTSRPDSAFYNISISYLFKSILDAYQSAKDAGYTHLWADTKKNPRILERLEDRVRAEYPQHYELCMELVARKAGALWDAEPM